ncbi:glycosyltransferase family 2 protein [Lutibacter sp.]|uniref:glycosyltransferase family 2 protein n=1 Tax=Lutibacter sp. TaxID=1925666 RepID=UPI001A28B20E|nr:glycosyltransferase family A protein [Lutibacter sp.]MBI9042238.1 glycosyltransferase family 2 protein [Lutibacter sp.]
MIIIYHKNKNVSKIVSESNGNIPFPLKKSIAFILKAVASQFPEELIVWCHEWYKDNLNSADLPNYFHHHKMILSFNPTDHHYFSSTMGYVEQSPFMNINKLVRYPTWQMSSAVGAIHASVLLALKKEITPTQDFDYFLNSFAKLSMPKGLFCYSEPNLLQGEYVKQAPKSSRMTVYKFVKQHYKLRWLFLLFLNELIFEKKCSVIPFIVALFYTSNRKVEVDLDKISIESSLKTLETATIDVIIPTIGRKAYLYDVLCDLRKQTHLPKNVIIVEQNPLEDSVSELDYLTNENWPFEIKHTFTHQAGACNARNIALREIESEWVFFADDDIRFDNKFISMAMNNMSSIGVEVASFACIQQHEIVPFTNYFQWNSFGSGCSIAKSTSIEQCKFEVGYEFGFGEDADFGMQLRKLGVDIYYLPSPYISHLKAPIGGFRTKPTLLWSDEIIQPKPSPTVMLFNLKHNTIEQLKGYKTILFFKYYKVQKIKNPITYFFSLHQQWNKSIFWANELMAKSKF